MEKNMDLVLKMVVLGRACRNSANIKNRQPILRMYVRSDSGLPDMFKDLVADELNLKEVVFTDDASRFTTYKFKPQLKTLGPKYGKLVPQIAKVLTEVDGNDVMQRFNKGETLAFEIDGTAVELLKADVLIETAQKEGFVSESDRMLPLYWTQTDSELIEEGFIREIISKIQTMRKKLISRFKTTLTSM
jgi:isoleucyl-tRNA synthetase